MLMRMRVHLQKNFPSPLQLSSRGQRNTEKSAVIVIINPKIMTYLIGCSGYYYPARIGKFYPSHLPKSEWLRLYASHFNAIEINNTFYRTPTLKTLQKRYNDTPEEFSFVLKIPQSITHEKKMQ